MTQPPRSQQLAALLATPQPLLWEWNWQVASTLAQFEYAWQDIPLESRQQQEQLLALIEQGRHERLVKHLEVPFQRQLNKLLDGLKQQLDHYVADIEIEPVTLLQHITKLQLDLYATRLLLENHQETQSYLLSASVAELSVLQRETTKMREEEPDAGHAPLCDNLDRQIAGARRTVLLQETAYFLKESEELVKRASLAPTAEDYAAVRAEAEAEAAKRAADEAGVAPEDFTSAPVRTKDDALARQALFCWRELLSGESLWLSMHSELYQSGGTLHPDLEKTYESTKRRTDVLRKTLNLKLSEMSQEYQQYWLSERVQDVLDQGDEQLANIDDVILPEALGIIEHLQHRVAWLLSHLKPLAELETPVQEKFTGQLQAFKRLEHRLVVEHQERKLQMRLENKFGKRFVSFFENLVLTLIFLVVALMFVELRGNLSPTSKLALMWVDTLICAVFLLEFGTKLVMVEHRWLYFRRHWLIDLLPSIPFAFIFWVIHTPAQAARSLTAGRAVRVIRLSRVARYIRFMRPIIRVFRITTFLVRAVDRLLRKYETLFNRNIVLFANRGELQQRSESLPIRELNQLQARCRRRLRLTLQNMPIEDRGAWMEKRLLVHQQVIEHFGATVTLRHSWQPVLSGDVRFEHLYEAMIKIDAIQVEELMGREFVVQANRILRYIAAPGVRRLPLLSRLANAFRENGSAEVVAILTRGVGRNFQRVQNLINWFGDLYGLITGPQVLDRIGLTMVKATLRPAKRLLTFGFLFLVVTVLIDAFSIGGLKTVASFLAKYLGTPIVVLGLVSLIPLLLGFWFRMIAGETTDYYSRISEAQFIGRLKELKLPRQNHDLQRLYRRVLFPEHIIREDSPPSDTMALAQLKEHRQQRSEAGSQLRAIPTQTTELPGFAPNPAYFNADGELDLSNVTKHDISWLERNRVILLYEDYLDGTPLHRSDIKTTNQLLGNITIQNIRRHRLTLSVLQNLRIEKLDLSKAKLLMYLGPYLWFASITESLSHRIGRLVVEYNQNCIPESELSWQTQDERYQYHQWLQYRQERLDGKPLPEARKNKNEQAFRTTEFSALHFISIHEGRDQAIRERFGERVYRLMRTERTNLIRDLFGFYPFHLMPRERRTFNFFQLYQQYAARGRIFLLPLSLLFALFKLLWWSVKSTIGLVRDVLRPPAKTVDIFAGHASFDVAIRQINRMRKPIYLESIRLRAMIDPEYMGFFLPGTERSGLEDQDIEHDLDFIDALASERREFAELRRTRELQLRDFHRYLKRKNWVDEGWHARLAEISPALTQRKNEALRAVASAYIADYQHLRTLMEADTNITKVFQRAHNKEPQRGFFRALGDLAGSVLRRFFFLRRDPDWQHFHLCWMQYAREHMGLVIEEEALVPKAAPKPEPEAHNEQEQKPEDEFAPPPMPRRKKLKPKSRKLPSPTLTEAQEEHRRRAWHFYLLQRKKRKIHFANAAAEPSHGNPAAEVERLFDEVIRRNSIWTEELLTLRTLQTLTQLDLKLYHELIYTLGNYDAPRDAD